MLTLLLLLSLVQDLANIVLGYEKVISQALNELRVTTLIWAISHSHGDWDIGIEKSVGGDQHGRLHFLGLACSIKAFDKLKGKLERCPWAAACNTVAIC